MAGSRRGGFVAGTALAGALAAVAVAGAWWWTRGSFDDYPKYYLGHIPDLGDVQVYLCACGSPDRHGRPDLHPGSQAGRLSIGFFDQHARGWEDYVFLGEMPHGIGPALEAIKARVAGRWRKEPRRAAVFADADVPASLRRALVRSLRAWGAQEVYDGMDPRPSN